MQYLGIQDHDLRLLHIKTIDQNRTSVTKNICWSDPWDVRRAEFRSCFLPVISAIPAAIAVTIILLQIISLSSTWRPRWTRPFVSEQSEKHNDELELGSQRRPNTFSFIVITLTASATALQVAAAFVSQTSPLDYLVPLTWLCVLAMLVVHRPRTIPFGVLIVLVFEAFAASISTAQSEQENEVIRVLDITSLIINIVAIIAVLFMPFRHPGLPTKDISAAFTTPTSALRSPEDCLTLWQFMTVSWMSPMISIGSERQLQDEDVWQLGYEFQHSRLHQTFKLLKGTVINRLIQANCIDLIILTILGLLETTLQYTVPVILQRLLASMQDRDAPVSATINYAGYMLLVRLIVVQSEVMSLWFGRRCYERSRGEMITMLYDKTLGRKISLASSVPQSNGSTSHQNVSTSNDKAETKSTMLGRLKAMFASAFGSRKGQIKEPASIGKILNLMRGDCYEVAQRFWEFQNLICIPLSVVYSAVLVVQFLGPSALIAITVVVIAQVLNLLFARILIMLEKQRRKATDDKLHIVSQFVESIRHLRWYGWQDAWLVKIMAARQHELNWRIITGLWNLLISFTNSLGLELAPAIGFFAYTIVSGGSLTIDIGFPAIQLMFMLTTSLRDIPQLITVILNAWVAVERIEDFMAEPNKDESTVVQTGDILALQHATLAWPGTSKPVLSDLNLSFSKGLTVIQGEVASGKTALLQSLLGELDLISGHLVRPNASIGYCAQSPWLQSMSIRENILFSAPYEEKRYADILDACELLPDLSELPAGDLSFIGENGIGLSGGQKARVALARAAYSKAEILFLDDPLSALDQHTAEKIVRKLLLGEIFENRTVLLVTHRTDLVASHAIQKILIENGRASVTNPDTANDIERTISKTSNKDESTQKAKVKAAIPVKFIEDEHRAHGGIKAGVYWEYLKAGRLHWWLLLIAILTAYRLLTVFQSWFIKDWGEAYKTEQRLFMLNDDQISTQSSLTDGLPPPDENVKPWLLIIFLIGIGRSVFGTTVNAVMLIIVYVTGKRMFKEIMTTVAYATFRFYDVTPVGRLMNRMTSDIGVIDGGISAQFQAIAWVGLSWASSIFVIAFVTPTFLVFSVLLTIIFVVIFRYFLPTSQSLRRLEMVSLTPLMSNFGELLNGLVTVRAFGAQPRFMDRVIRVVDNFQKMDHFYWSLQAWLMYRYDALSAISSFLIVILALATGVSPGLTAFVMLSASKFVRSTHQLCKEYGQLQMEFVSVERVVELMHLTQEPPGKASVPAWWPSFNGNIEFKNVTIKYAEHLEPALYEVSFTIKAGSKVAVLGRTGSGKSTLALALLATISPVEGQIIMDNVDLAEVDKQTLRTRVTFLAQDPVLFPGTMRQNLDPLIEHSDDECEAVLQRVCERQGWSLDTYVEGGGKNLSQGQRQLVGLARAVLRRSAIVILDEATASIDYETSMQIQQVLHEDMKDSTVITIAHRLEAVSNADVCIVLDKGRLARQGPAAELLADSRNTALSSE
ncbi:hypothetical protein MRB53_041561 [Persea americana]|nr:hypothetical protein MRB53_041561 [Persea americana]